MNNKTLVAIYLAFSTCFFSQFANSEEVDTVDNIWQIMYIEGLTETRSVNSETSNLDWKNISVGDSLTSPAFLRTGPDSRIVLKHRNDKITIASNSLLKLEEEKYTEEGIITKIIQTIGYALFDIEKNTGRKNIVETSYLLSVVKGTTFTVQVDEKSAIVDLIEGRLEIKAKNFDSSIMINTGQIAQLAKGETAISVVDASTQVRPQTFLKNLNTRGKSQEAHDKKTRSKPVKKTLPKNKHSNTTSDNSVPAAHNSAVKDSVLITNGVVDKVLPGNKGRRGMGNNGNDKGKGNSLPE